MDTIPPIKWASTHPRIAAWGVLSAGMIILLVIEARNIGLSVGNWLALIVMTVLVAGACIWIVSWEDVDEEAELAAESPVAATPETESEKQR